MRPDFRFLFRHPAHFFALGLGSGLVPKAPGTAGSLAAIPLFWLFPAWPLVWNLALVAVLFGFGCWCSAVTGRALGDADHGSIVWDEMVAMWGLLLFVPQTVPWFAAAFLLFRLFDVWKPYPIRWFDRNVHGGFGAMLDDALAALFALAVLMGLQLLACNQWSCNG